MIRSGEDLYNQKKLVEQNFGLSFRLDDATDSPKVAIVAELVAGLDDYIILALLEINRQSHRLQPVFML